MLKKGIHKTFITCQLHKNISSAGTLVVMKVVMQSDDKVLDEVVVTGYGVQRKASFTGAATIVGEDVIAKKSDANFVKALEGAVPGVHQYAGYLGVYLCTRTWLVELRYATAVCH